MLVEEKYESNPQFLFQWKSCDEELPGLDFGLLFSCDIS